MDSSHGVKQRRATNVIQPMPPMIHTQSIVSAWYGRKRVQENVANALRYAFPIIPAHSQLKSSWDLFILLFVIYNAISVPLETGFEIEKLDGIATFESIVDLLFIFDIILSFRTAYVDDHGMMIRDDKKIAAHYLHTWFAVDCLASIPFEYIAIIGGFNTSSQLTYLSFLKTPRLLRLGRLLRFCDRMKNAHMFKIVRLMLLMFFIAHWIACIWHTLYVFTKNHLRWTLTDWEQTATSVQYLNAYYRSFLMMSGENIDPQNNLERIFCCIVFVLGACFTATIVGNMALLINYMNTTAAHHKQRHDMVHDAVRYLGIGGKLQKRIEDYFDYLRQYAHPGPQGMHCLATLPRALFEDVCLAVYSETMDKLPLFEGCDRTMITYLTTRLRFEIYLPGETIFRIGDIGRCFCLVMKGKVAVLNRNQELIAMMSEGESFGEIALFTDTRRTATCIALSHCDLAVLDSTDLKTTMAEFPESADRVRAHAARSLQELQCGGLFPDDAPIEPEASLSRSSSQCLSFVSKPLHTQKSLHRGGTLSKGGSYTFLRMTRSISESIPEDLLDFEAPAPQPHAHSQGNIRRQTRHRDDTNRPPRDALITQMQGLQSQLDAIYSQLAMAAHHG